MVAEDARSLWSAGLTVADHAGRHVTENDTPSTDNTTIANGDTWCNEAISSNPGLRSNIDWTDANCKAMI
jgi:hypothetical protein